MDTECRLPLWKMIDVGGMTVDELIKELAKKKFSTSAWANELICHPSFVVNTIPKRTRLMLATPHELEFTNKLSPPTLEQIIERAQLRQLRDCSGEVGLYTRLNTPTQKKNERLWIASKPLPDAHNYPNLFCVGRNDDDECWLGAGSASGTWPLDTKFLFTVDDTVFM